jgi:hypothetical protein
MTKLKAFATHIGISLVIFFAILAFIMYFWYPQPFFASDGGWQGIRIIAAVDLVLGPVLTLIVFKPGKPRLKMDLTIIGLVQAGALAWGIWVVHFERPIAAVFLDDTFHTVTANDMKSRGMTREKLNTFGDRTPVWIYSELPDSTKDVETLLKEAMSLGRSIHLFIEYYKPMNEDAKNTMLTKGFDLADWVKDKPEDKKIYDDFINKYSSEKDNMIFFHWDARYDKNFVALRKSDLSYIATLDITSPKEVRMATH